MVILTSAKINLTLDVGARRPDGYHDIRSIMQTIGLYDTLAVAETLFWSGIHLEIAGDEAAGVPTDETNLVYRAAACLQEIAADRGTLSRPAEYGLEIKLHKCIPSQAGLGGGSSDAAATLLVVNRLLGLNLPLSRLAEIGASLGADVPFFLKGGTALVEGLGERITSRPPLEPPWPLVIVKPPVGVSTAAAYAALDALPNRVPGQATEAWREGAGFLSNDFEQVILPAYPEVAAAYDLLCWTDNSGESFRPLLCGSGSALFCRVRTNEQAQRLARRVRTAKVGKVWVTWTQEARPES